jgi:hypothetical protein
MTVNFLQINRPLVKLEELAVREHDALNPILTGQYTDEQYSAWKQAWRELWQAASGDSATVFEVQGWVHGFRPHISSAPVQEVQ